MNCKTSQFATGLSRPSVLSLPFNRNIFFPLPNKEQHTRLINHFCCPFFFPLLAAGLAGAAGSFPSARANCFFKSRRTATAASMEALSALAVFNSRTLSPLYQIENDIILALLNHD